MRTSSSSALSADIHLLGDLLGDTIRRLAGEEAFGLVEEVRHAAKALRGQPAPEEARELVDRLAGLPLPMLRTLIRAFSVYFDLINLAEQQARLRAVRQRRRECFPRPITESPEEALHRLRRQGVAAERLDAYLRRAAIVPVFTAHPTEARRRTILLKLRKIARALDHMERVDLLPREQEQAIAAIREQIEGLWLAETVRVRRPTVLDEVQQSLRVVEDALFGILPALYRGIDEALRRVYPEHAWTLPSFLRFGSWIGGDRDGNPYVTSLVTIEALKLQQQMVLNHYRQRLTELEPTLSQSRRLAPPGPELIASLERDAELFPEVRRLPEHEPYRLKCRYIAAKLTRTLEHLAQLAPRWSERTEGPPPDVYFERAALRADFELIAEGLRHAGASAAASGAIADLIRLVDVLGLHLLTIDIRQHSARHASALAEILDRAGVCPDYEGLSPEARFDLLAHQLDNPRPLIPTHLRYSEPTTEVVATFRAVAAILEQQCPEAIHTYIISMTKEPAHLLEVLLLAREAELFRPSEGISRLNIVPLFESLAELKHAPRIMSQLFELPVYRRHLGFRGDCQEVMIGYSDSNKESGFLQSVWALYRVERDLVAAAKPYGITVPMFHGRGGAVGRGGGPANKVILAQPRGTIEGRMRVTEQGEMIADRYGRPEIAERHLEQILHAVLLASFPSEQEQPDPAWDDVMDTLAASARRHYRDLVYETPEFLTYFEQATPITEIARLKIGSRPSRRKDSTDIDDLRAIPWVFSWMQSRHTLPGWYGLGSAIDEFLGDHPDALATLQDMYQHWPFWTTTLDNAQVILAKADPTIMRLYADLVEDPELADRIYGRIRDEYHRTVTAIGRVTGQNELLDNQGFLKLSIERRNPYVDPLSFIQLVLIRRLRAGDEAHDELLAGVLESINGIAAGLKNTG